MDKRKNVCFICSTEERNTNYNNIYKFHLKDSKHFAISDVKDTDTYFVEVLRNFTNLSLNKNEILNHLICSKCEFSFIDAYLIRQDIIQRCQLNRITLTDSINTPTTNNYSKSVVPKTEPKKIYFHDEDELSTESDIKILEKDPCLILIDDDSNQSDKSNNNDQDEQQSLLNKLQIPTQGIRIITMDKISADGKPRTNERNYEKNKIQEDNVGFRMLQRIGWSGGSLGKNMTGIEEPIQVDVRTNRKGLGAITNDNSNKFHYQVVYQFLKKYSYSTENRDYIFGNEFSERHKNVVFGICKRVKLHTRRIGDKNNFSVLQISKTPLLE